MSFFVVAFPCERWEGCSLGGAVRVKLEMDGRIRICLIGSEHLELAEIMARRISDRAHVVPLDRAAALNLSDLDSDAVTVLLLNREEELEDFFRIPENRGRYARKITVQGESGSGP